MLRSILKIPILMSFLVFPIFLEAHPLQELEGVLSKVSHLHRQGGDSYTTGNQINIEGCRSYPHYSPIVNENRGGHLKLREDIYQAVDKGLRCLLNPENKFAQVHRDRALKVLRYLSDSVLPKTFSCLPGINTKVNANSNWPDFDRNHIAFQELGELMPDFPGIAFNTNRMAGNERIFVMPGLAWWKNPDLGGGFKDWAQKRFMTRGTPVGGLKLQATAMLVFHEMIHWAEVFHTPGLMDDILVYEMACFGENTYDRSVDKDLMVEAQNFLRDEQYWSATEQERLRQTGLKNYHALTMKLENHKIGGAQSWDVPERALPQGWTQFHLGQTVFYGPKGHVQLVQDILEFFQRLPRQSLVQSFLRGFEKNEAIIYLDSLRNEKDQALLMKEELVFRATFESVGSDLRRQEIYSGKETRQAFLSILERNEYGQSLDFFSSKTQRRVLFPRPLGVNDWVVMMAFHPKDQRVLSSGEEDSLGIGLKESLVLSLAKTAMYLDRQSTQGASESYPAKVLDIYRGF